MNSLWRLFSGGTRLVGEFLSRPGQEHVIKGVPVTSIDESGHGVLHLYVRREKQTYEFNFARTLPGEKLNLLVSSAKQDRFKKKELEGRGAVSAMNMS